MSTTSTTTTTTTTSTTTTTTDRPFKKVLIFRYTHFSSLTGGSNRPFRCLDCQTCGVQAFKKLLCVDKSRARGGQRTTTSQVCQLDHNFHHYGRHDHDHDCHGHGREPQPSRFHHHHRFNLRCLLHQHLHHNPFPLFANRLFHPDPPCRRQVLSREQVRARLSSQRWFSTRRARIRWELIDLISTKKARIRQVQIQVQVILNPISTRQRSGENWTLSVQVKIQVQVQVDIESDQNKEGKDKVKVEVDQYKWKYKYKYKYK